MFTPHELDVPADGPGTLRLGAMVAAYRIKRLVGKGGMGAVYKAENTAIGRTVAIKVLHSHLADDGVTLKRFQREARAAAGIGPSRVVEVLDMGVEASGEPYIVSGVRAWRSLSQLVRPDHPISVRRAADIAGRSWTPSAPCTRPASCTRPQARQRAAHRAARPAGLREGVRLRHRHVRGVGLGRHVHG
ncbi:MAG: hypothetical protein IPH72_32370 [Sandaracinaceae bacterium]|nr:hypothetical protein [Sandaracinaceae bacterium]